MGQWPLDGQSGESKGNIFQSITDVARKGLDDSSGYTDPPSEEKTPQQATTAPHAHCDANPVCDESTLCRSVNTDTVPLLADHEMIATKSKMADVPPTYSISECQPHVEPAAKMKSFRILEEAQKPATGADTRELAPDIVALGRRESRPMAERSAHVPLGLTARRRVTGFLPDTSDQSSQFSDVTGSFGVDSFEDYSVDSLDGFPALDLNKIKFIPEHAPASRTGERQRSHSY